MALIQKYYTVHGVIIGARDGAGARTNYALDAIGSVTGTIVEMALENTYAFKPYGQQLAQTGSGLDPAFNWVGTRGYRSMRRRYCEVYVRARHYSVAYARWTATDPLWFSRKMTSLPVRGYSYAGGAPTTNVDPSGLAIQNSIGPKDRIEGPVDPMRIAEAPSNYVNFGMTGCEIASGSTWRWARYLGDLDSEQDRLECTWQHEHLHVTQLQACCRAASRAFWQTVSLIPQAAPFLYVMFRNEFYDWVDQNEPFLEAPAWGVSADCLCNKMDKNCELSTEVGYCDDMNLWRLRAVDAEMNEILDQAGRRFTGCPFPGHKRPRKVAGGR